MSNEFVYIVVGSDHYLQRLEDDGDHAENVDIAVEEIAMDQKALTENVKMFFMANPLNRICDFEPGVYDYIRAMLRMDCKAQLLICNRMTRKFYHWKTGEQCSAANAAETCEIKEDLMETWAKVVTE